MKAARIPQGDLRDKIFACFRRFTYWSMKALRAAIPQPEAWLRQNLEEVAVLHKSGRFANQWSLKNEYVQSFGNGKFEIAPDTNADGDTSEIDGDDDDDSIKMEDVLPS